MAAPCKNPNCNSYGQSHPNCKCYNGMATGGEVVHYCDKEKPHEKKCRYYADGGVVGTLHNLPHDYSVVGHMVHAGMLGMLKHWKSQNLAKYDSSVKNGHKYIDDELGNIFSGKKSASEDRSKNVSDLHDWIDKGGMLDHIREEVYNQNDPIRLMATGGEAHKDSPGVHKAHPVESIYPQQNVMLSAAKARISNYLNTLKPNKFVPKLAFDNPPDMHHQKHLYDKALKIADHPMSVMRDVTKGTVDKEELLHLSSMYPEVYDALKRKVTEKITESQIDGKKPNNKVRQGLSIFLGVPLSTEYTASAIQTAQAAFANKKPQQAQPQSKSKGDKSAISKSDDAFLTGNQALVQRSQREKS